MSKISDYRLLKQLKGLEFARRLGDRLGLILPKKDLIDRHQNICALCGKQKVDPVLWFGEYFCRKCVDEKDPNKNYEKNFRGKRGFAVKMGK